jgi:hypothetical protein
MAERSPAPVLRHRRVYLMGLPPGSAQARCSLQLLKKRLYLSHKSDHVLHLAYNALLNGQRLKDIELRRNGKALLAGLGARPILIREPAGDKPEASIKIHFEEPWKRSTLRADPVWETEPQDSSRKFFFKKEQEKSLVAFLNMRFRRRTRTGMGDYH